jgi:hypothetical protein
MLDKMTVVKKRKELLTLLDGDVLYDIWKWPRVMEQSFWRKPIGDVDVFKLLLESYRLTFTANVKPLTKFLIL